MPPARILFRTAIFLVSASLFLIAGAAASERLAVTSSTANIRSGPGGNYDVVWQAEQYYPIEVLRRSGSWILFQDFEGDRGWIHKSLVGQVPTVIARTPASPVRAGPGAKEKVLFTVDSGIPFRVLERRKEWIRVEHADGDRGWIHRSAVW